MISDEKFAVSQELMEQAYDYLKDGYEQALNALEEAEAENTKLRKELDAEHALAETLGHYHEHAQAENDRLRELFNETLIRLVAANEAAGGGFMDARYCELLESHGIEVDG